MYVLMGVDIVPFQTGVPIATTSYKPGSFFVSYIVVSFFEPASLPDFNQPNAPDLLFSSSTSSMSHFRMPVIASATFLVVPVLE